MGYANLIVAAKRARQHVAVLSHVVGSKFGEVNRVACDFLAWVGVAFCLDGQLVGVMICSRTIPLNGKLANLVGQRIFAQRLQGVWVHQQVL